MEIVSLRMSITRKQTATVIFPWSTMGFATIEPRPIHKPIMKEAHDGVEVRTEDDTIFEWTHAGDVIRKSPSGEVTTWWGVPTMSELVKRPGDGTFCQFYSDGRVTMSLDKFTWFWGPPELGSFTDGYIRIISCSCCECYRERWEDYRDW